MTHEDGREHEDGRGQHGDVAPEDREVHQPAGARPVEHRLDEDRPAQQIAELQAHQRQRRGRRILQRVIQHAPVQQALGVQRADELLAQDFQHVGAHQPADHAHRDQRQGDDRQDQMLDMLPAGRDALEAHALRRQHVEDDGKDRHQHDADPVVRQADADDRGGGEQLVEPGVVIVGGQRAQQHPEQEAQHRRRQGEHERIAQRAEQLLRHRPVGEEGDAEISDQKAAEPSQVLHVDRLVEAEAPAQAVRDLLRHLRRHQDVDDVARGEVDQSENQHRHAEQDRHGVEQAAKGIRPHGPLTSGGRWRGAMARAVRRPWP